MYKRDNSLCVVVSSTNDSIKIICFQIRRIIQLALHYLMPNEFDAQLHSKTKTVRKKFNTLGHLLTSPVITLRLKPLIYQAVLRPANYLHKASLERVQIDILRHAIRRICRPKGSRNVREVRRVVAEFIKPLFNSATPVRQHS